MRRIGMHAALAACMFVTHGSASEQESYMLGFQDKFETFSSERWARAQYDFSHPKFDTDWRKAHAIVNDDGVHLSLVPKQGAANRFDGASMRHTSATHFGRYEVMLQPARGAGVVTGFFTYSGPYYGTRHDEIDIEFLGRDTTKMHIAWFVDGVMKNKLVDLGYDAADRPRLYAFEWSPHAVRWFADGEKVFETTIDDGKIPQIPGFVFVNLWAADPSIATWSGLSDPSKSYSALLGMVAYAPEDQVPEIAFEP